MQPELSGNEMSSTLAPVADALSDDEKAMLNALWMDAPSWMTATLSAIEALGSNSVSKAWVIAALSEEASVVGVVGGTWSGAG